MKKLFLFKLVMICALFSYAQDRFIGRWEGKPSSIPMRLVFHVVKTADGQFNASFDSPDQGIKGIKASHIRLTSDSIYIEASQFQLKFAGTIADDSLINGQLSQGISIPLNLKKVKGIAEIIRPQTPKPPFPYKSENILYTNADRTLTYGATITIPEGKGPFPAVLLLTGSGDQDRDEQILNHRPFAVIADHLTRNGFVVLRVDDRSVGQTTGKPGGTTKDFADDAQVSFEYLLNRNEVDKKKAGLLGHSEGGMIAQILGADRKDIAFIIMLAGPGTKIIDLMVDQNKAILSKTGLPQQSLSAYLDLYRNIATVIASSDSAAASVKAREVLSTWITQTDPGIVVSTTGIQDNTSRETFAKNLIDQLNKPWFRYFLQYDPSVNLKKISASVLALNGDKDIQVIAGTNLPAIEAALKDRKNNAPYRIMELPGLNHLFQQCTSCTVNEYGILEQTIFPGVLDIITEWMRSVSK